LAMSFQYFPTPDIFFSSITVDFPPPFFVSPTVVVSIQESPLLFLRFLLQVVRTKGNFPFLMALHVPPDAITLFFSNIPTRPTPQRIVSYSHIPRSYFTFVLCISPQFFFPPCEVMFLPPSRAFFRHCPPSCSLSFLSLVPRTFPTTLNLILLSPFPPEIPLYPFSHFPGFKTTGTARILPLVPPESFPIQKTRSIPPRPPMSTMPLATHPFPVSQVIVPPECFSAFPDLISRLYLQCSFFLPVP